MPLGGSQKELEWLKKQCDAIRRFEVDQTARAEHLQKEREKAQARARQRACLAPADSRRVAICHPPSVIDGTAGVAPCGRGWQARGQRKKTVDTKEQPKEEKALKEKAEVVALARRPACTRPPSLLLCSTAVCVRSRGLLLADGAG